MFKCQPGYTLRKIKGINYLLPYGQQIADLKKGFVLNETSTFLWNVLQHHEGAEPQQLAEILARTYQLDESYYPELLKDVTDFLTQLTAHGNDHRRSPPDFINPFCLYDNRRNLHKTIRFCRTDFPKFQTFLS